MRVMSFAAPCRAVASMAAPKAMRPVALQSSFMGNTSITAGLCSSFAGMSLSTAHRSGPAQRQSLVVQANGKKSMGCTLEGTRRKKIRVSGFRARMATPAGRRVLAARRRKGRKRLCPAQKYRK